MHKIWTIQFAWVALIMVGSLSCTMKKHVSLNAASSYDSTGTIGIKNLDQLAPSYAQITGIPMDATMPFSSNQKLSDQYDSIAPWLSPDGAVDSVNASMLLAITGYAGSVCKLFIAAEAALASGSRKVYGPVNFAAGPMGLTDATLATVHTNAAKRCWARNPSSDELQILSDAVKDAITGLGTVGTTSSALSQAVQDVLLVSCTAIMASPECIKS